VLLRPNFSYIFHFPSPISFFTLSSHLYLSSLSSTLPFSAFAVLNVHLPISLRPHSFQFPYSLLLWIQFQSVNIYPTNTPALRPLSSRKSILTAATAQSLLCLSYGLKDREILIGFLEEIRNFLLFNTSRQVLLHIQTAIQYISGSISSEVNGQFCDTDHLLSFSTEFKNQWSYTLPRTMP